MKRVEATGLPRFPELEDQYQIVGELGRGGTSVVYRALEKELGRDVAIKVVRSNDDGEAVARLAREAKLVAGLRHPNVVPLLGIKHLRDGLALIMQHVPGRTLKQAIRQDGQLPIAFAEHVLREIGSALDYAHKRHGIIHRDIKPENIYLDEEVGRALLSDFGIARSTESESTLTLVGTALGTPAYMSPEQIDGGTLDGRSDLYSLGLVAYEMLTAQQPWAGHNLYTIIYKQKNEDLPPITDFRKDVPAYLVRAIDSLLRKDVATRCADAMQFIAQLPGAPVAAPTFTPAPRAPEVLPPPAVSDDSPTLRYQRPAAIEVPVDMPPQVVEPAAVEKPVVAEPDPALAAVAAAMAAAGQEPQVQAEEAPEAAVLELPTVRPNWRRSPARTRGGNVPAAYALPEVTSVTHASADTEVAATPATPRPNRRSRMVAAITVILILGASATVVAMRNNGDEQPSDEMTDTPASQQRQTSGPLLKSSGDNAALGAGGTALKAGTTTKPEHNVADARPDSSDAPIKPLPVPNVQVPTINPEPVGEKLTTADFTTAAVIPSSTRVDVKTDAPAFTPYTIEPELRNRTEVQRALRDNYPRVLRERNVGGSVRLWVLIDTAGRVLRTEVQESSGNELLDRAAIRVANVMHFTPAMNRDRKVSVWTLLPIHFRTQE